MLAASALVKRPPPRSQSFDLSSDKTPQGWEAGWARCLKGCLRRERRTSELRFVMSLRRGFALHLVFLIAVGVRDRPYQFSTSKIFWTRDNVDKKNNY